MKGLKKQPPVPEKVTRLWQRIRWYPWRSRDEWIHSQEGAWWPWPEPRLDSHGKANPNYAPPSPRGRGLRDAGYTDLEPK
jgi:hypothetical protein